MGKKKLLIIIISIAVVVIAAVSIILAVVLNKPKANNDNILDSARTIKIVQIEGSATVTDESGTNDCFKGMNLYNGDKVNVNADSVLVIKFDEDKYTYLGENTIINIKSEGKDKFKTNIYVEQGKVLAEIQKPLDVDEEFFLSSNNSVMAVRGTIFGVTVLKTQTEVKQTYSVYKGVTELYVFDKVNNEVIKGKLSDISNKKIEVVVPTDKLMSQDEYKEITDNWMKDISKTFDDPTDANENLDEVNITVDVPSKEDYEDVTNTISGGSSATYSAIKYSATGYIGQYDGQPHKINVKVDTPNAKVYYKAEGENDYKETNDYEYTNVGSYRVYYKIVCEGYDTKEDYEVIQITKASIFLQNVGKTSLEAALEGKLFIAGAPLQTFMDLASIDLSSFYNISLVMADSNKNATFDLSQEVVSGKNTYQIGVVLPDDIKGNYNSVTLPITITASELQFVESDAIENGALDINYIHTFNKYNGVKIEELFAGYIINDASGNISSNYGFDISYKYDYLTEGFYELVDGINSVDLIVTLLDETGAPTSIAVNLKANFSFIDGRSDSTIELNPTITSFGEDNYCYEASDAQANRYTISGAQLKEMLGISSNRDGQIFVNPSFDSVDYASASAPDNLLTDNLNLSFEKDKVSTIEFVLFASSSYHTYTKKIFIYFTDVIPTTYPTYTISDNLVYRYSEDGCRITFVTSDSPVVYSLDGQNYTENLVISEVGEYKVYFKVGDSIVIEDYRMVTVKKGTITSDNLSMIENTINIISNDGHELTYGYSGEEVGGYSPVTSYDGTTITSLTEVFEIYSNMLKNSVYYDSMSKEVIETTVTVTRNQNSNLVFDYEISAENYETVKGSITFAYSEFGYQSYVKQANSIIVSNPSDVDISAELLDTISATPVFISLEDESVVVTSGLYSVDFGKTWTTEPPVVSGVGEYYVYMIYDVKDSNYNTPDPTKYPQGSTLSRDGNYIIAIQKIVITE